MWGEKKISVILNSKNNAALSRLAGKLKMKLGPVTNMLISSFVDIPGSISDDIYDLCRQRVTELKNLFDTLDKDSYTAADTWNNINKYIDIARIVKTEPDITIDDLYISKADSGEEDKMTRIPVKDGVAVIPSDWIILNKDEAKEKRYACIVEFMNWDKYNIPHFCYFTNDNLGKDYDTEVIKEKCQEAWPKFNDMLKKEVKLKRDPIDNSILNGDEWRKSPHVGFFSLATSDDYDIEHDKIPFGAYILRNNDENEE